MTKKILSVVIALASLLSFFACDNGAPAVTGEQTAQTGALPGTEYVTEAFETEPFKDEDPVFYEPVEKEKTDIENYDFKNTDWEGTIKTSNAYANAVQGGYNDAARTGFTFSNLNMSLSYDILASRKMYVTKLANSAGVPYFENSMDAYIRTDDGKIYLASESILSGRININRMGYYYYGVRECDQTFIAEGSREPLKEGEAYFDVLEAFGDSVEGNNVRDLKYENGILSFKLNTLTDPNIVFKGLEFYTDEYDAVQITLKTGAADCSHLFLKAQGRAYGPDQQLTFRFDAGKWQTVVLPLTAMNNYSAEVMKDLKLSPISTQTKDPIEIKEVKLLKRGEASIPMKLERTYHTYPDKMNEEVRAVAPSKIEVDGDLGVMIKIPVDTVRKAVFKNEKGETDKLEGFDFSTAEYVGFDIKGAGIFGVILPDTEEDNGELKVEVKDGNYVITHSIRMEEWYAKDESTRLYHRIYTTDSHQFNDLRKQAYTERNPLTDIQVIKNEFRSSFTKYDPARGCYTYLMPGSGFVDAYYQNPDQHKNLVTVIGGDGAADRTIYINAHTTSGALESAVVLDEASRLLPIPVQVSKNFGGEYEEKAYDPGDVSYGDAIFPVTVAADASYKMEVIHLYQNWGNFPLKQLSSVSFINPYYHLSVGVTETNCIAPYFVYGRDAWTLPDFRSNSAPLWDSQPQHTSGGRLYFLQYTDSGRKYNMSESTCADIDSAGPVYADVKMDYISDDGRIKAEYRHVELPQTDENRTYYHIKLTVLEDVTFDDFKNDFSIFSCDGRFPKYEKLGYLDENGEQVTVDANKKRPVNNIVLGKEYPYFDVFKPNGEDCINLAAIIKDSDITIDGKKYEGNFVLCDSFYGNLNHLSLSLDLGKVTLKKGDVIELDMILLPWGYSDSENDGNVRAVRQDSCIAPYKLGVIKGEEIADPFVLKVKAENGEAEFTLTGGRNNAVVRVYGFEKRSLPEIKLVTEQGEETYGVHGAADYDGYQVYYDEDGTYSFSFAVDTDKSESYHFIIKQ